MTDIDSLLNIMEKLRDPETGCPWDKTQTPESISPYTLEEAYEVYDAVEKKDAAQLKEELGDLLLHIVFYAQMAKEKGLFYSPFSFASSQMASISCRVMSWRSRPSRMVCSSR